MLSPEPSYKSDRLISDLAAHIAHLFYTAHELKKKVARYSPVITECGDNQLFVNHLELKQICYYGMYFFRTIELPVHGGTPFEKGVDVDPSVGRRGQCLFVNLSKSSQD